MGVEAASQASNEGDHHGGVADVGHMAATGSPTLKQLAWSWASSTIMVIAGMIIHYTDPGVWMVVYAYSPLMALPLVLCLMHLWQKGPWLISLLMLMVCYGAQWCFILADMRPWLVILTGGLSALVTGLISTKLGDRLSPKPLFYLLLFTSGMLSMVLFFLLGKEGALPIVLAVWFWQFSVGSLLVLASASKGGQ